MAADSLQDFAFAFLSILFEGAPFILLGTLISGFVDVYLPAGTMDRFLPRNKFLAVAVAGLLGAVFPVCECAVVPVIRRLVKKGLPVSCALTYMLAAPIVNPITALSTWKAFQGQGAGLMMCSRLALGFAIAAAVGWIVSALPLRAVLKPKLAGELEAAGNRETRRSAAPATGILGGTVPQHAAFDLKSARFFPAKTRAETGDDRLVAAFRSALKDFIDVGVYFAVGVTITALFNTGIAPGAEWLDSLAGHPAQASAAMMALAFVLSLCSTSDAFIAATLAKFGFGAKLAFLTFGPMMDMKLLFLYQTVMRKRFIFLLAAGLFLAIGVASVCLGPAFTPPP